MNPITSEQVAEWNAAGPDHFWWYVAATDQLLITTTEQTPTPTDDFWWYDAAADRFLITTDQTPPTAGALSLLYLMPWDQVWHDQWSGDWQAAADQLNKLLASAGYLTLTEQEN